MKNKKTTSITTRTAAIEHNLLQKKKCSQHLVKNLHINNINSIRKI